MNLHWLSAILESENTYIVSIVCRRWEFANCRSILFESDIENHVKQAGKNVIRLIHDLGLFLSLKEDQHPS
ncbi:hypothetical protein IGI04_039739 [Brassica rapa subsp. trilocularis]|uniref:Uncharacterized protein n=1 Tax=Brassica rapa subsp. trilocularis TaxID=1813537 RepID=A0ABQ7KKR3_BRACM|nr:hypothetical protein IGI04_039739 [Brassica rapa subsp. trilocularis]